MGYSIGRNFYFIVTVMGDHYRVFTGEVIIAVPYESNMIAFERSLVMALEFLGNNI